MAVVGHGIWVLAAAIFSIGTMPRRVERAAQRRHGDRACLGCGEMVAWDDDACDHCGLDPESREADELRDLEAAVRTVQRLRSDGTLSAASAE